MAAMTNLFAHLLHGASRVSVFKPIMVPGLRSLDSERGPSKPASLRVGLFLFPLFVFILSSRDNEGYCAVRRAVHFVQYRMHCISLRYSTRLQSVLSKQGVNLPLKYSGDSR